MKRYFILTPLALTLLSSNVLATEIHNGKLLSHKEWSDSNLKGSFKEATIDVSTKNHSKLSQIISERSLSNTNDISDDIYASADLERHEWPIEPGINYIRGYATGGIINATKSQQIYTITSHLCIRFTTQSSEGTCITSEDKVLLDPNGFYDYGKAPALLYDFNKTDDFYTISIWSDIEKDGLNTHFHTSAYESIRVADTLKAK